METSYDSRSVDWNNWNLPMLGKLKAARTIQMDASTPKGCAEKYYRNFYDNISLTIYGSCCPNTPFTHANMDCAVCTVPSSINPYPNNLRKRCSHRKKKELVEHTHILWFWLAQSNPIMQEYRGFYDDIRYLFELEYVSHSFRNHMPKIFLSFSADHFNSPHL